MSSGIKLLQTYESKLVEALAQTDLLKLSRDLHSHRVISKEMMNSITSLDHKWVAPKTRARYFLHLVQVRINIDPALAIAFFSIVGDADHGGVAKIGRALSQLLVTRDNSAAEEANCSLFLEAEVPYLVECLSDVAYMWEEISISLQLPINIIEECKSASSNKLKLHKAVTEWVCGYHKYARPSSLMELKHALASGTVQQWRLAAEIEDRLRALMTMTSAPPSEIHSLSLSCVQLQFESTSTTVTDGKSALLEVQVRSLEPVAYLWMKDNQPLSEGSAFSGTHTSMLLIHQASQGKEGEYSCRIRCGDLLLTSSQITVTVKYQRFKQCLLDLYMTQSEVPQDSWPLVSLSTYIDVSLIKTNKQQNSESNFFIEGEIESLLEQRERVEYADGFSEYEKGALVLVEGRPGSGKTTLAQKLTKDWAKGKILQNVNMLFLVSLRNDKTDSSLFRSFFHSKSKVVQQKLEISGGAGVCFIFDGYDEFTPMHGEHSVITKLISKAYLPLAMVIVTSRPAATATLRPKASRRIEILGFTYKQFMEFVRSFPFESLMDPSKELASADSKLMTHLKACTNVLNMCYLPINACIICFLYSQSPGISMPKTETEIYERLIVAILLRKLLVNDPTAKLHSLKDLKGPDQRLFNQICFKAFCMTVENKQILDDFPEPLDSLNRSPIRGLLTIDHISKLSGLETVLTFLHLTLQEYLAAYYIASLDELEQMVMIEQHGGKKHLLTMFKFYCGLVSFENKIHQFVKVTDMCYGHDVLYTCHCAYETQEDAVCHKSMELLKGDISVCMAVLTPADFTALGYVISTSPADVTTVNIFNCLLYEEFLDDKWKDREFDKTDPLLYSFESDAGMYPNAKKCIEDLVCTHISYHYKEQSGLVLYKLKTMSESFRHKFDVDVGGRTEVEESSSDLFCSENALPFARALKDCTGLQYLQLCGNYRSRKTASVIANILKRATDLQDVRISGCNMSSACATTLVKGLRNCKCLRRLYLANMDLSSDGSVALAGALKHNNSLQELKLLHCGITCKGADAIVTDLKSNKEFLKLSIQYNKLGCNGAEALSKRIHYFNELNIINNAIGSIGVKAIAQGLESLSITRAVLGKFPIGLFLDNNKIDPSGIVALAEGMKCCSVCALTLSQNDVGAAGAAALACGLRTSTDLQYLVLQHCSLPLDGIIAIAGELHCLSNLTYLDLSDNATILEGAAVLIAEGLRYLRHLEQLYLSRSGINDESAKALTEGLQCCSKLHSLILSKNAIGSSGAVALADSLKCSNMILVSFSHNNVDVESVEALAALVRTCHLERLDLSFNNLGSTGALCLITELFLNIRPVKLNLLNNRVSPKAETSLSAILCKSHTLCAVLSNSQASSALLKDMQGKSIYIIVSYILHNLLISSEIRLINFLYSMLYLLLLLMPWYYCLFILILVRHTLMLIWILFLVKFTDWNKFFGL